MSERAENDILDPKEMATIFKVNQRTLLRMVKAGSAPPPLGGLRPPYRWRWGAVLKWYAAMETLYGVGFLGGKRDKKATNFDSFEQNAETKSEGSGGPKKTR